MIKEIPMLFSTPMAIAIDIKSKTETRRTKGLEDVNKSPDRWEFIRLWDGHAKFCEVGNHINEKHIKCPYGKVGDLIWVRENYLKPPALTPKLLRLGADTWPKYDHVANCSPNEIENYKEWGWKVKPSIHMPKAVTRLWLEIIDIKVERLQDISEHDAKAEGVTLNGGVGRHENRQWAMSFAILWSLINGSNSWNSNPWVWVIKFKQVNK
jgi:hypothetical protein